MCFLFSPFPEHGGAKGQGSRQRPVDFTMLSFHANMAQTYFQLSLFVVS